jgi:hypothetical protein
MFPRNTNQLLLAIAFASLLLAAPAGAQGLGLDLDLGDIGVDLDVGGGNGLDLDVDLGDDAGIDVSVGNDGIGLDVDAGGIDPLDAATLGSGSTTLSQEAALQAVRRGTALPLDEILLRAALIIEGEVIDAQLIAVRNVLLYELKVLGSSGKVSDVYFYARSGLPVE